MHNRLGHRFQRRIDIPVWLERGPQGLAYADKVKNIFGDFLCAYWIQGEDAGAVADNFEGTAARDGAYTAVALGGEGIGDGNTAPFFDGTAFNDTYSDSLRDDCFNGQEIAIACWGRMSGAGAWTDGLIHNLFSLRANGSNIVRILKPITNGQLRWHYIGGGTTDDIIRPGNSTTDWFHMLLTASLSDDELKAYLNGVQEGVTQSGLGTYAGTIASFGVNVGAATNAPTEAFEGWLAHAVIGCGVGVAAAVSAEAEALATV